MELPFEISTGNNEDGNSQSSADDSCDFGFYEHKGLTQAMRRRSRAYWPGVDPEKDEFYVYVYEQEL